MSIHSRCRSPNQTIQGLYPQTVGAMWICANRWNDSIASQILHKVMSIKILDGIDGVQGGKIILIRHFNLYPSLQEEAETATHRWLGGITTIGEKNDFK